MCVYRFIDSYQFLKASLDELVRNTPKESLNYTATLPHHEVLTRKGVYPYEYMDSFAKFEERELPPQEAFHSSLTGEEISEDQYQHAKSVWQVCNCENMGDYHDRYLETDIYLLADIFENFRKTALKTYGLDPAHYFTLPGNVTHR